MNPMRTIRVEKVTLNIGAGKDLDKLEKGMKLFKIITGRTPVKTFTKKRIPAWGLRPGLPIGCKITLRKSIATELLKRLLDARDHLLNEQQFDINGNIAFGIPEYIDIPGIKYEPDIGIMGFEVCVTLERPGFRIKRRGIYKKKISHKHAVTKEEAIDFMKKEYKVKLGEEE
jgi:large subunit ribosomal protein L5